ncbi:hypothetical protein CAOG_06916 [Capsaspora owczarzaki ATCC 30864]|uniref:DDB1- and CUL4-associated factor 15 WD40 repeat-containing domain-containing protein n=1 Tax=Capsaspora owczarzaki (strain ATCC 30864) TaxID=595528 RepID=A0A0D2VY66_CAPO3|nr:hypothetical protein CAOG_06916 [Capsaspora owczarzaki ATCC 30864]KJE96617.1 hypothetical protein CAOG_006916 [Capsaspora owczarzaki ATCC 30864]|eukprot:XP_004344537.2 hypothetical protein CAOG_06916 [Capsaspora owczarzaki ATCC 30864]
MSALPLPHVLLYRELHGGLPLLPAPPPRLRQTAAPPAAASAVTQPLSSAGSERRRRRRQSELLRRLSGPATSLTSKRLLAARLFPRPLPSANVPLRAIHDAEGQIVQGCVLLGFSGDGRFMLSYMSEVAPARLQSSFSFFESVTLFTYSFVTWRFDPHQPLACHSKTPLFRGTAHKTLLLQVAESPCGRRYVITGFEQEHAADGLACRNCYMSIVSHTPDEQPGVGPQKPVYDRVCEIALPSPLSFITSGVSLVLDDLYVFNTGEQLLVVDFRTDPQASLVGSNGTEASRPVSDQLHAAIDTTNSPLQRLQTPAALVEQPSEILTRRISLEGILANLAAHPKFGFGRECLRVIDYNGYLIDVCRQSRQAILLLACVAKSTNQPGHTPVLPPGEEPVHVLTYQLMIPLDGEAEPSSRRGLRLAGFERISMRQAECTTAALIARTLRRAQALIHQLRVVSAEPAQQVFSTWTNRTVLAGQSLPGLRHPLWPLAVTMTSPAVGVRSMPNA